MTAVVGRRDRRYERLLAASIGVGGGLINLDRCRPRAAAVERLAEGDAVDRDRAGTRRRARRALEAVVLPDNIEGPGPLVDRDAVQKSPRRVPPGPNPE